MGFKAISDNAGFAHYVGSMANVVTTTTTTTTSGNRGRMVVA